MTNTNDLGEVFPAGTAAHRIEQSIRALTAGFRYRLLELANGEDRAVARRAETVTDRVSLALHSLEYALAEAARLMTQQGVRVEGRDIEEEDRAVVELLDGLRTMAADLKANCSYNYDDRSAGYSEGQESAGVALEDSLTSWAATRAAKGRNPRFRG